MIELNWLAMAVDVVRRVRVNGQIFEEAVQETALAGWIAAERWSPDGGMAYRSWVWQAMERGCYDFLRLRLGRQGQRAAWEKSLKYLDEPARDGVTSCGEFIPDQVDDYQRIEQGLDLCRLICNAGLTDHEFDTIAGVLTEETLKTTGARWGLTEARACQIRKAAFKKLREAA